MACPYCDSYDWEYDPDRDSVTDYSEFDEGVCYHFVFAECSECEKKFVLRNTWTMTEWGRVMTMEEYEKRSE